jgi:polar amino acid transport system permease protein
MLHESRHSFTARAISFLIALLLLTTLVFSAFYILQSRYHLQWDWASVWRYRRLYVDGWYATLGIAVIALPASCLLGLAFALARRSAFLPLQYTGRLIVELTRSTPLLVQIWLYFYVFGTVLLMENRYIVGPLCLAAFHGAYVSEIIRAGIEGIGATQLESARAIGLSRVQTYRYVIFPQAIRQILPSLAGQFVSLVKDSSLLSVIGLAELTKAAGDVSSNTFAQFESYVPLTIGYLIITLPISLWTQHLERRVKFNT